jgi:hypothetical protein
MPDGCPQGEKGVRGLPGKTNTLSRVELEFMRSELQEEIAGLQIQLEWVNSALAQLDES